MGAVPCAVMCPAVPLALAPAGEYRPRRELAGCMRRDSCVRTAEVRCHMQMCAGRTPQSRVESRLAPAAAGSPCFSAFCFVSPVSGCAPRADRTRAEKAESRAVSYSVGSGSRMLDLLSRRTIHTYLLVAHGGGAHADSALRTYHQISKKAGLRHDKRCSHASARTSRSCAH